MVRFLVVLFIAVGTPVMARDGDIQAQHPKSYSKTPKEVFGDRIVQYLWEGNKAAAAAELQALDEWLARNGKPPRAVPQPDPSRRSTYQYKSRVMTLPPEAR
jgi:hypothetical protein